MIELKEYNGRKYADVRDIYDYLEISKYFSEWCRSAVKNAFLIEGEDFYTYRCKSTGGRPSIGYLLTERAAIRIVLQSRMPKSVDLENVIIDAFKEKQTGISLKVEQVTALTDMVKAMTLVSVQKKAENKHFDYLNRPKDWWNYRAELLGYSTESLKTAISQIGKNYKSQKQALIHLDPAEIIRTGVVDLLMALGRDREYALNIGEWAKAIAISNGYHFQIWNDMKSNPLGLNLPEIIDRQNIGNKYLK